MEQSQRCDKLFELFNDLVVVHGHVTSEIGRRLPAGVLFSHFIVIDFLYRNPEGRTPAQIAQELVVAKPTMTNTLARLLSRGYVTTYANPDDGRSKIVLLTDAGAACRRDAVDVLRPTLEHLFDRMPGEEHDAVRDALRVFRNRLAAWA